MKIPHSTEPNIQRISVRSMRQIGGRYHFQIGQFVVCLFTKLSTHDEINSTILTLTTSIDYSTIAILSFNCHIQYLCRFVQIYFRLFMSLIDLNRIKYRTPFFLFSPVKYIYSNTVYCLMFHIQPRNHPSCVSVHDPDT